MPGEGYSAKGIRTTSETTLATLWGETDGATPTRLWVYDALFSMVTAGDNQVEFTATFATAGTPTGTAVTPQSLSQTDAAAATSDWLETLTANPMTFAADPVLNFSVNQRATWRWVASPGRELVVAAVAGSGLAFRQATDAAITKTVNCHFVE